MLTKQELEAVLKKGCANCCSKINEKEKVTKVMLQGVHPGGSKSHFEALSFIYKMPPEELISNVQSYFQDVIANPSNQSKNTKELFSQNFGFCGRCARLFGAVYRAHRIFSQWSNVNNLLFKAIRRNKIQLRENDIHMEIEESETTITGDIETEIKSEVDDDEVNSPSALQDEENSNHEIFLQPTGSFNFSDVETPETTNIQSEKNKCQLDAKQISNNEKHHLKNRKWIISHTDFNDKTTPKENSTDLATQKTIIKRHTFICPKCDKLFPDLAGVMMHCKDDHRLNLSSKCSRADTSEFEKLKTTDEFKTYISVIRKSPYYCPSCSARNLSFTSLIELSAHCKTKHNLLLPKITTHKEIITGPPFQCPKCDRSFISQPGLFDHCTNRHLLLFPAKRKSKRGRFTCSKCKCEFKNSNGWKLHSRRIHFDSFFCNLCTNSFPTNEDLVLHLKTGCKAIGSNISESRGPSNLSQDSGNSTQDDNQSLSKSSVVTKENQTKDTQPKNITIVTVKKENTENMASPVNARKSPNRTGGSTSTNIDSVSVDRSVYHYLCSECKEHFFAAKDFKQHLKTAHYEKFVSCQPSQPANDSVDPAVVPSVNSPLNCTKCGLSFEHYDLLQKHSQDIHSITLGSYEEIFFHYICRKCGHLSPTVAALSSHLTKFCAAGSVKMFDCKYCPTTFNSTQKLTAHMKFVHDIEIPSLSLGDKPKTPKCSICCKVFISDSDLYYHKMLSRDEMRASAVPAENPSGGKDNNAEFICQPCNIRFGTTVGLKLHLRAKHRDKVSTSSIGPFNCNVCIKSFTTRKQMQTHVRYVHLKKTKKCKICNKQLSVSSMLRHIRAAHTSYRPFKCQHCKKTFVSAYDCKKHEAIHSDACPFVCSICGKGFKLKISLIYHEETHSTEKSHMCERCGISLKTSRTYRLHMRLHKQDDLAGSTPKCSECNKVFSTGAQLRTHKILKHSKHGPIPCPVCGKKFSLRSRVNTHLKTVHPESL